MPAWLVQLLIALAIKVGVPALVALLPKLPQWAQDIVAELIKQLQGHNITITEAKELKRAAYAEAKQKIKTRQGVGTPPSIKKESV